MVTKLICLALALCCVVSAASENRIVGGSPATIEEFPSVIALVYHYQRPNIYIQRCVGSLVSSWHVITTAFCFTGAVITNVRIRAGSAESLSGGQVTDVRQVIQHPDYQAEGRINDIAIVVLSRALPLSDTLNIAYIPPANTFLPDGLETRIASWGFETEDGPQHSSLKAITLTTVNLETCRLAYEDEDDIKITDTNLCAASEGMGTCFGDSGAPMIYNRVLLGVASYYKECGNSTYPDVFTRIDKFTDWILESAVAPTGESSVRIASV